MFLVVPECSRQVLIQVSLSSLLPAPAGSSQPEFSLSHWPEVLSGELLKGFNLSPQKRPVTVSWLKFAKFALVSRDVLCYLLKPSVEFVSIFCFFSRVLDRRKGEGCVGRALAPLCELPVPTPLFSFKSKITNVTNNDNALPIIQRQRNATFLPQLLGSVFLQQKLDAAVSAVCEIARTGRG